MNPVLNLMPERDEIAKWGTLAYVSSEERQRIMELPAGQSRSAIERIQGYVDAAGKEHEKHAAVMENAARAMPAGGTCSDMTQTERKWVMQLQRVRLPLQGRDRDFITSMAEFPQITDKQGAYIRALAYKYRRQM